MLKSGNAQPESSTTDKQVLKRAEPRVTTPIVARRRTKSKKIWGMSAAKRRAEAGQQASAGRQFRHCREAIQVSVSLLSRLVAPHPSLRTARETPQAAKSAAL